MNKLILSAFVSFCTILPAKAQIGINTSTPDSSSAMDIQSPPGGSDNRGVLFPRMTSSERLAIQNPANSLFVFDTTDKLFYYYDGEKWLGLIPKESGTGTSPTIKGNVILDSGNVILESGKVQTPNLKVSDFPLNSLVPAGAIMMWSGDLNPLPDGWGLCDGSHYAPNNITYAPNSLPPFSIFGLISSPDLRGKFVVGYDPTDTDYNSLAMMGGEKEVTLTASQSGSPAHSHTASTTGSVGGSKANITTANSNGSDEGRVRVGADNGLTSSDNRQQSDHTHSWSGSTTVNASTPQNAAASHENRPPYYVIAYIIKKP